MTRRLFPLFFDTKDISLGALTDYANGLCEQQRDNNWQLGDAVRAAKRDLGTENWSQAFPEWYSVAHLERCEGVALAYPNRGSRNRLATWTIHMKHANADDRIALVQAAVDAGRTSDEERKVKVEPEPETTATPEKSEPTSKKRRLIAVDVNYEVTRRFDTMGLEAGGEAAAWIERLVERLKNDWDFTDAVCCFDSPSNFRKVLTADWPEKDRYKEGRSKKDPEHIRQLEICEELLVWKGFCCCKQTGFEADDIMASYGKQFCGKVVLATPDKDMRQCLSDSCSMLPKIEWIEDPESGEMRHEYHWVTAKIHCKDGVTYSQYEVKGVPASEWVEFQTLAGDGTDNVSGAVGVGPKNAIDLLNEFGSIEGAIAAAKKDHPSITPSKRRALIEFEGRLEVTRKLVTLVDTLPITTTTRI